MLKIICDYVEAETKKLPIIYSGYYFMMALDSHTTPWLKRLPLCLAVYPYDNYSQAEYLTTIKQIMDGTKPLPAISIPQPWDATDYVQITGRLPVNFIPGYSKETNWALTADLDIKIEKPVPPPIPAFPAYSSIYSVNVRETPSGTGKWLGVLPANTIVYVDILNPNGYNHFVPTPDFPQGGYAFYLQKA
jgi:hypothetical protein